MKGTILDFLKLAAEKSELAQELVELAAKHDFEFSDEVSDGVPLDVRVDTLHALGRGKHLETLRGRLVGLMGVENNAHLGKRLLQVGHSVEGKGAHDALEAAISEG